MRQEIEERAPTWEEVIAWVMVGWVLGMATCGCLVIG